MADAALREVLTEVRDNMRISWDVPIPMSDGTILRADIFRPTDENPCPVIMSHGCYAKGLSFQEAYAAQWERMTRDFPQITQGTSGKYQCWEVADPERWVPQGYVVIDADSRGAGSSPGMLDPFSPREIDDYATLITWAAHQTWSSGKVGLIGTSYQAINQWMVAARQPEGLAAILPWDGAFDYYRESPSTVEYSIPHGNFGGITR